MANGIPVIMVWKKGRNYIPDHTYVGSDKAGLNEFVNLMLSNFKYKMNIHIYIILE